MHETYMLGYDRAAMAFVEGRRLHLNGAFLLPNLAGGMRVLDCGCGPETITLDIGERIAPGSAVGIDMSQAQVELAAQAWWAASAAGRTREEAENDVPDGMPPVE